MCIEHVVRSSVLAACPLLSQSPACTRPSFATSTRGHAGRAAGLCGDGCPGSDSMTWLTRPRLWL